MKMNFYKKMYSVLTLALCLSFATNINAQNQGLYADTIKWPNSNAITVNIKSAGFSNVLNFQGSIKWDKNSLQYVSVVGNTVALGNNFLFGTSNAVSQGVVTYIFSDAAANHTVADGTTVMSINFTVINNPVSTFNDNVVYFSNNPTTIGIDTAADVSGLSDFASLVFPNTENHINGYVSFARPPVLSYASGNVTDSITNRPAGCTYQWTLDGNPVSGTSINSYNNSPTGSVCLTITYPNNTSVNCGTGSVLPVKLNNFIGKNIDHTNQLSWLTTTEINTNNFEIERSINGKEFTKIGVVKAAGNATIAQNYLFKDAAIVNSTLYYRLKMNDNDGKYAYSNTVKITSETKSAVSMYPNPAKGFVTIAAEKIEQILVTDILGKIVLQAKFNFTNNATLNIATLKSGVYLINIKNAVNTKTVKLIVE